MKWVTHKVSHKVSHKVILIQTQLGVDKCQILPAFSSGSYFSTDDSWSSDHLGSRLGRVSQVSPNLRECRTKLRTECRTFSKVSHIWRVAILGTVPNISEIWIPCPQHHKKDLPNRNLVEQQSLLTIPKIMMWYEACKWAYRNYQIHLTEPTS